MGMTRTPSGRSPCRLAATLLVGMLASALSGCDSLNYSADFADNGLFYADVPFRTRAPGDRELFVAPVADGRRPEQLPMSDNGFPIQYGGDEFWERPVPTMLGDVLVRQLEYSELFPAIIEQAGPGSLVMKPELVMFAVGVQEGISGSMTFAEVGVRVQVFGPEQADGTRPLWHDQIYGNRQRSEYEVKPISPYRLVGRALQMTMSKALTSLDGCNVARSNVPVDVKVPAGPEGAPAAPPAEAAARRR